MRVVWTQTALRGIWRAYEYLTDFNPRAAVHLAESLLAGRRQPGEFSASWPAGARHEYARAGDGQSLHHPLPRHGRYGGHFTGAPRLAPANKAVAPVGARRAPKLFNRGRVEALSAPTLG